MPALVDGKGMLERGHLQVQNAVADPTKELRVRVPGDHMEAEVSGREGEVRRRRSIPTPRFAMADLTVGAINGFPDRDRLGCGGDGIDEVFVIPALRQNNDKQQNETKRGGASHYEPYRSSAKPPHRWL